MVSGYSPKNRLYIGGTPGGAGILNGDPLQALVNNAAISPKDAVGGRLGCAATPLDTWRTAPVKMPDVVGFCTPS